MLFFQVLNTKFTRKTMAYNALTDDTRDTAVFSWNGSTLDTVSITVASDGTTITLSIEKASGGDLTFVFSDGFYNYDTTPAATLTLTAGSNSSPQINYIYFLQSSKTLTASTVGWPATEHAPLATVLCQSAASLQTQGSYQLRSWTNHTVNQANQGHVSDINFWIREQNSSWISGVDPTLTITPNGASPDNVIFTSTAGKILQLHDHVFPAFTGTPNMYVVNDSVAAYTVTTDLNTLLTDSLGVSMSNRYFALVIWGVVNKNTGDSKLFVNLPSGTYGTDDLLLADANNYTNFTIPPVFKGTGFLIAKFNLRHQTSAGGTWTKIGSTINLRGLVPSIIAGGSGSGGGVEFADNTFRIFDNGDNSKKIAFEASGIATATVRTLTVQDRNGTIALKDLAITSVNDAASPYTVLDTDIVIACNVSAGVVTVNLPNAPTTGRVVYIKDSTGDAVTNNITITTVGGVVTIDGATSQVMNTAFQSITALFDGTKYLII